MKNRLFQFILFGMLISTLSVSCSKEKIEANTANQKSSSQRSTTASESSSSSSSTASGESSAHSGCTSGG